MAEHEVEVPQPIICSPFDEPAEHWRIEEGVEPRRLTGRRPAQYFYRAPGTDTGAEILVTAATCTGTGGSW